MMLENILQAFKALRSHAINGGFSYSLVRVVEHGVSQPFEGAV